MSQRTRVPVVCLVGSSGSGKTTLLEGVLPVLRRSAWRVAVIKHAGAGFDLEEAGKDSERVRNAGAAQVLVASRERWALIVERAGRPGDPSLDELVARFDPAEVDLILVEGFAHETYPKIEVYRPAHGRAPVAWPADPSVVGVASDQPLGLASSIALLDLNQPDAVAAFIMGLVPRMAARDSNPSGGLR
jgi:molybdopterin-guanine dinucleotide biosynthesis adapter protein